MPLLFRLDPNVLTLKLSGSCKQGAIASDERLHLRSAACTTDPPLAPQIRCSYLRSATRTSDPALAHPNRWNHRSTAGTSDPTLTQPIHRRHLQSGPRTTDPTTICTNIPKQKIPAPQYSPEPQYIITNARANAISKNQ
jgi:hypothetical protein